MELFIDVQVEDGTVQAIQQALAGRQVVALDTLDEGRHEVIPHPGGQPPATGFRRWYYPQRQLFVYGKGPNAYTLAQLAQNSDFDVSLQSPDPATLAVCEGTGIAAGRLTTPDSADVPPLDSHSAAVLMFHEHDWEPPLLRQLLRTECFYLGALGSSRTHQQRCEQLVAEGFTDAPRRIHGPVGLDIGAGNPVEIALSILAEIVWDYRREPGSRPLLCLAGKLAVSAAS